MFRFLLTNHCPLKHTTNTWIWATIISLTTVLIYYWAQISFRNIMITFIWFVWMTSNGYLLSWNCFVHAWIPLKAVSIHSKTQLLFLLNMYFNSIHFLFPFCSFQNNGRQRPRSLEQSIQRCKDINWCPCISQQIPHFFMFIAM